jgi:large subunit ribosomal protein L6
MSRIGKLPISIPAGVNITINDTLVTVKGPKGVLTQEINPNVVITVEGNECIVTRQNDEKQSRSFHGLYRSLINNMVIGVSEGYKKTLELVGVGYRVSNQGQVIEFALGYTHNIFLSLPDTIKIETKSERNQNPVLILESSDKQLIGQVCAKIRSFRKPEPYKGKGIKFVGEQLRRKAGKSASS